MNKSYKEKVNPFPHESGRKGRKVYSNPIESWNELEEDQNLNYQEYNAKEEISSVLGESAYDAEQEIYDNINYKLGSTDISADLLEVLQYNDQHEEVEETENIQNEPTINIVNNSDYEETFSTEEDEKELNSIENIINDDFDDDSYLYEDSQPYYGSFGDKSGELIVPKGTIKKRRSKKPYRLSDKDWDKYQKEMKSPEKRKKYYEDLKEYYKKIKKIQKELTQTQ